MLTSGLSPCRKAWRRLSASRDDGHGWLGPAALAAVALLAALLSLPPFPRPATASGRTLPHRYGTGPIRTMALPCLCVSLASCWRNGSTSHR